MRREYQMVDDVVSRIQRKVVLFGAGHIGRAALDFFRTLDISVHCFCDNDENKTGQYLDGVKVVRPDELPHLGNDALIVISSLHYPEMRKQLDHLGISNDMIGYEHFRNIYFNAKSDLFSLQATGAERCMGWLQRHTSKKGGILIHSNTDRSYPEVTGYIIPTLIDYGMRTFALELAHWLLGVQLMDGGFPGAGTNKLFLFDTAQALRGLLPFFDVSEALYAGAQKAMRCLRRGMINNGMGGFTRQYESYGNGGIPESIMLYALSPLLAAAKIFDIENYKDYAVAVEKCADFYACGERFLDPKTLLHFLSYEIEAMIDLGRQEKVMSTLSALAEIQKEDGSVEAFKGAGWVCVPGLAQLAVCWYKIGMNTPADRAMAWLDAHQEQSGGFLGSIGAGAEYFPQNELSWGVKFYMDACRWRIKRHFDANAEKFPLQIDSKDGRLLAVTEEINNTTGQVIAEIGCGRGRFLKALREHFPDNTYIGVDISQQMLNSLPDDIQAVEGSLENIPLPDNSVSVVFSVEAIEHSLNVSGAVAEIARVCKPGGKIIIIDKQESKWGRLVCPPWERWPDRDVLTAMLKHYCANATSVVIHIDDAIVNENLMVKWVGINAFGIAEIDEDPDMRNAIYRTVYFDEMNKTLVTKAKEGDCHYFVRILYDHYFDHQGLWPDEMLETRYVFQRLIELLNYGDISYLLLDVGCGNCELIYKLQITGYEVMGVDLSIVRVLNNRDRIRKLFFGFSEYLPIEDDRVDIVICCECLEHCMDVKAALRELRRVLKPGGTAYIQVPLEDKIDCSWHLRLFSVEALGRLVSDELVIEQIDIIPYLFGESPNNIFCIAKKPQAVEYQ